MRGRAQPPPGYYADEPVVFRTGPHWISTDMTLGLGALVAGSAAYAYFVDPNFWRFVGIPLAPFLIRLAVDIPRYWHFSVVLTSRHLVVDVGIVRDVYHTLRLAHIRDVRLEQTGLGRVLGYGDVHVLLDAIDENGRRHTGTYSMRFVRDPVRFHDALVRAVRAVGVPLPERDVGGGPQRGKELGRAPTSV